MVKRKASRFGPLGMFISDWLTTLSARRLSRRKGPTERARIKAKTRQMRADLNLSELEILR
jgi:hypothetical protein